MILQTHILDGDDSYEIVFEGSKILTITKYNSSYEQEVKFQELPDEIREAVIEKVCEKGD